MPRKTTSLEALNWAAIGAQIRVGQILALDIMQVAQLLAERLPAR